jgi:hypothetical protein
MGMYWKFYSITVAPVILWMKSDLIINPYPANVENMVSS